MKVPILDLKRQYREIAPELEPRALEAMRSGAYIMGPAVADFERELASYLGVKHVVTVGNGTDALIIALRALGIGVGDEVITTPFTFFATAEAIVAVGATPVFADVDPETYNIDPKSVERKITKKTKVILPVHIFGQPADMTALTGLARANNLRLVEDACQAIGAEIGTADMGRKKAGCVGDFGCFSFYPTKNLGAFGDGGAVATDSDELAVVCRALREHCGGKNGAAARDIMEGRPAHPDGGPVDALYNPYKYYNYMTGYNSRLDTFQAEILRVKLPHVDGWNSRRAWNAAYYLDNLKGVGVGLPGVLPGVKHVWHQFAVRTRYKAEMGAFLASRGVSTGVFYPVPLHLQKAFDTLGYRPGDLPAAEALTSESLCLPVFPELTEEELDYVVSQIREFCATKG